ncbi:hypothetical protein evm_007280 [Chilo suppressalis]|nr:hypothetical protein evm_007280 [Chilo suppressalis]
MFINDSIDVETKEKKSHRIRSWYLYEQYKSLERNQLDAAQKLKERSYQDNILRQELRERRSRRKLYDGFDLSCERECHVQGSTSDDVKATLSRSSEDFFESFCELQEDKSNKDSELDSSIEETFSQDDSQIGKRYLDAYKDLEDIKDDQSYEESIHSVVENYKSDEDFLAADLQEKLMVVQKNITAQLDQQKANNFEKYAKTCNDYKISESHSPTKLYSSITVTAIMTMDRNF